MPFDHDRPTSYRVFISYTSREPEVKVLRSFIEHVMEELDRRLREVVSSVVWLDLIEIEHRQHRDEVMYRMLDDGVRGSSKLLAFVSPLYWMSEWCRFEWTTAEENDIRRAPIVWRGDDPVSAWFPPRGPGLDARPFFVDKPFDEAVDPALIEANRAFGTRLSEYRLFSAFVDEIYGFLIERPAAPPRYDWERALYYEHR